MTEGDVLALFPGSKDDKELTVQLTKQTEFGNSSFAITPAKYGAKEFAGTNQVSFGLLDDRVTSYTVAYNGPEYPHVDNFVAKFIEGRNLPSAEQWEAQPGLEHQLKVLSCVDFEVRVFAGGAGGSQNYILVTDTEAVKELKDRRKRAREKASPTPGQ